MHPDIQAYNEQQSATDKLICAYLAEIIDRELPGAESKIWHRHPVWFIDSNPVAGYSRQKGGIRLMFWSGADFEEEDLNVRGEKFRDASIFYSDLNAVDTEALIRWLGKAKHIQWDYKNLIKRKGRLERLK